MDAIYKTWHMCARRDDDYYATDLLTDILGGGASSRLYQSLVKEQQLFANINCYHFGSLDKGLLTIEGQLIKLRPLQKNGLEIFLQVSNTNAIFLQNLNKLKQED